MEFRLSGRDIETHPFAIEIHPRATDTHPGVVEAHLGPKRIILQSGRLPWSQEAHRRAFEAHLDLEAHSGAMEAAGT